MFTRNEKTIKSSPVFAVIGNTGSKAQQSKQHWKLLNDQTVPSNNVINFFHKHHFNEFYCLFTSIVYLPSLKLQITSMYQCNSGYDSRCHSSIFCLYSHVGSKNCEIVQFLKALSEKKQLLGEPLDQIS